MEVSLEMVEMVVICSGIRLHVSTHGSVTVISQRTRERENEMMGGGGGGGGNQNLNQRIESYHSHD